MEQTKREMLIELAMDIVENDANDGICLHCLEVRGGVEPDADGYKCEGCGRNEVSGAELIILRYS